MKSPFMATMFDLLPLDVIKFEILPFVANDYFARMGINGILQPEERVSTPLRKNAVAELEMSIALYGYKKDNLNQQEFTASERGKKLMAIFDFLNKNPTFLKYDKNYRNATIKKVEEYSDPNFPQYAVLNEDEVAQLVSKAKQVVETLAKNPYVCEIVCGTLEPIWSPIAGAKPRVIVNNSALLEAAERERSSKPHWRLVTKTRFIRSSRNYDHEYEEDEDWEYGYFDKNEWVKLYED